MSAHSSTAAAVDEIVRTRRSIRDFSREGVDLDAVVHVVKLAAMAPSAWNLQPWRFVVVTDQTTRTNLQAASFGQKQVGEAPVVVALYCDMVASLGRIDEALHPTMPDAAKAMYKGNITAAFDRMTPAERDAWGTAQGNIALGYLLLLLEIHGFVTSPMLGFDPPSVRQILGLPDYATIPALVAIGKPGPTPLSPPHRFPFDDLVRFVGPTG